MPLPAILFGAALVGYLYHQGVIGNRPITRQGESLVRKAELKKAERERRLAEEKARKRG